MMTLEQEQDGLEPHLKDHHRTISSSKPSKVLLQSSSLEFLHTPPHEYMKSSSAGDIDFPTSLSLSASSSISPKSSASTLFTRAQIRLSSKFPKRVQSTLFPVRENKEVNQNRGILGHRGSASVTSLRETSRDEEDSEDDRVKMSSITESIIGYHVPWRYYHRKKFTVDSDEPHLFHRESTQSLNMPLQISQLADQHTLTEPTRPHSISSWRPTTDMFDNSSAPSTLRCADLIGGHLSAGLRPTSPFSVSDSSDGEPLDVIPFGVAGLRHRCQCLLSQDAISAKDLGTLLESSELLALGYDDIASQKDISYIREQLQAEQIDSTAMLKQLLTIADNLHFEPTMTLPADGYVIEDVFPSKVPSEHLDLQTRWFRRHFVGKAYATFVGPNHIISVVREEAREFCGPGNAAAKILGQQYRIIIRTSKLPDQRHVIHEVVANEMENRIECSKGGGNSGHGSINSNSKRVPFSSRHTRNRTMRAAVASVFPEADLGSFKELSAEETIHLGLEREFLRFDESGSPNHYKFGVMVVKPGQTIEEDWFSNTDCSPSFWRMMNAIANKVELKGYLGWAGGLDTKTGESGTHVYTSKWKDFDIVYHVAPLIPARKSDRQQIHRKRHVGNDIVSLIFLEGDAKFCPAMIKSQFLHVFILVREEMVDNHVAWRIEVIYNENVPEFGPVLPAPALIYSAHDLRAFLSTKLINAENAALKSPKFAVPNARAREGILENLIKTGTKPGSPSGITRSSTGVSSDPLSARVRRGAVRSESSLAPPNLPPMPTPSRSSMLKELTGLARRRSGVQEKVKKEPPRRASSAPTRDKDSMKNKTASAPNPPLPTESVKTVQPTRSYSTTKVSTSRAKPAVNNKSTTTQPNASDGKSTMMLERSDLPSPADHLPPMGLTAFKSRAHNLFMIGRRETSKPDKAQPDNSKRFLRTSAALQKLTPSMTMSTKSPSKSPSQPLDSKSQRG